MLLTTERSGVILPPWMFGAIGASWSGDTALKRGHSFPPMPAAIEPPLTQAQVRDAIHKGKILASVLKTSSQPYTELPDRDKMRGVLEVLTRAAALALPKVPQ